jgi:hydrogenase maturation protease
MHQSDLVDTLICCGLAGNRPDAVVVGVEPYDYQTMAVDISPHMAEKMPVVLDVALDEIKKAGGEFTPLSHAGDEA